MNPETPCGTCGHPWDVHLSETCFDGWVWDVEEWVPGPDACECVSWQVPL